MENWQLPQSLETAACKQINSTKAQMILLYKCSMKKKHFKLIMKTWVKDKKTKKHFKLVQDEGACKNKLYITGC